MEEKMRERLDELHGSCDGMMDQDSCMVSPCSCPYKEEKRVVNLTPHAITVVSHWDSEVLVRYEPEETPARVSSETVFMGDLNGIPVTQTVFGEVTGLPPEAENTWYIVSRMVANATEGRYDLLVPGLQVRNADGQVVGCESLDWAK